MIQPVNADRKLLAFCVRLTFSKMFSSGNVPTYSQMSCFVFSNFRQPIVVVSVSKSYVWSFPTRLRTTPLLQFGHWPFYLLNQCCRPIIVRAYPDWQVHQKDLSYGISVLLWSKSQTESCDRSEANEWTYPSMTNRYGSFPGTLPKKQFSANLCWVWATGDMARQACQKSRKGNKSQIFALLISFFFFFAVMKFKEHKVPVSVSWRIFFSIYSKARSKDKRFRFQPIRQTFPTTPMQETRQLKSIDGPERSAHAYARDCMSLQHKAACSSPFDLAFTALFFTFYSAVWLFFFLWTTKRQHTRQRPPYSAQTFTCPPCSRNERSVATELKQLEMTSGVIPKKTCHRVLPFCRR